MALPLSFRSCTAINRTWQGKRDLPLTQPDAVFVDECDAVQLEYVRVFACHARELGEEAFDRV
jgi:hypothetical protein